MLQKKKKKSFGLVSQGGVSRLFAVGFQMLICTWRCERYTSASAVHLYQSETKQLEAQNAVIAIVIGHEKRCLIVGANGGQ